MFYSSKIRDLLEFLHYSFTNVIFQNLYFFEIYNLKYDANYEFLKARNVTVK